MTKRHPLTIVVAGFAAALWSGLGVAADGADRRFYVSGSAGYGFFDEFNQRGNTLDLDDEAGFAVAFGKPIFDVLNVEIYGFSFSGVQTERTEGTSTTQGETDIQGYGLNLIYFPDRRDLRLYGIFGYAQGEYETQDGAAIDADFLDLGIGYERDLLDYGLAVRAEYRIRTADLDRPGFESTDQVLSLGLTLPLGPAPSKE